MFAFLRNFLKVMPEGPPCDTYITLVAQARNPFFYESLGVPDTLDGRFEVIVLHLFLMQHRLLAEKSPEAYAFGRDISEVFFADMDRSIREMGIADTGVKRRIKAMAKAYHGRLQAYAAAIHGHEPFMFALSRNLYGTVSEGNPLHLAQMADYAIAATVHLASTDINILLSAGYVWHEPNPHSYKIASMA